MVCQLIRPGIVVIENLSVCIDPGDTKILHMHIGFQIRILTGVFFTEHPGGPENLRIHLQIFFYLPLKQSIENKGHADQRCNDTHHRC